MANQPELFNVSKCATCKKCGSNTVFWCKSLRTGRFYLVDVTNGQTTRQTFHKCVPVAKPAQPQSPKCCKCAAVATKALDVPTGAKAQTYCESCYDIALAIMAEDKACNDYEESVAAYAREHALGLHAGMGCGCELDEQIEKKDPVDTLISANKDVLAERLNALFKASPDAISITDTTTNTTTTSKVIPVTDEVIKTLDHMANARAAQEKQRQNSVPNAGGRLDDAGMVRNIPCHHCGQLVSYREFLIHTKA